jgi:hypothetical protein
MLSFSSELSLNFAFSEDEALQVLADLHGGGDKSNELVVLEHEEIRQQVYGTISKVFNGNIEPVIFFGRFTSSALKVRDRIWTC